MSTGPQASDRPMLINLLREAQQDANLRAALERDPLLVARAYGVGASMTAIRRWLGLADNLSTQDVIGVIIGRLPDSVTSPKNPDDEGCSS